MKTKFFKDNKNINSLNTQYAAQKNYEKNIEKITIYVANMLSKETKNSKEYICWMSQLLNCFNYNKM